MATASKMMEEMTTRFEKSMQDLKEELNETEFSIAEESIKDDWDMKTLLIMLSECLVIMGVFFEATGTCVKLYGCRIRLASKHKAMGAIRADPVVSYPKLSLTNTASSKLNDQTPEATIPPPGPKRGRKANPKGPTMTGGQCGPQPPPGVAEEGKGHTAKARRGTPKKPNKQGAGEGNPPVRRSARQQAARLNG